MHIYRKREYRDGSIILQYRGAQELALRAVCALLTFD
jgi:hypothetical protein